MNNLGKRIKKIVYLFLFCKTSFSLSEILQIPDPIMLKKVYNIFEAKNVEYIAEFSRYQDFVGYGELPNCLNETDIKTLNSTVNWSDAQAYQIKSKKTLYIAKMHKAFVASSYLGTVFDQKQQFLFDLDAIPGGGIFWPVQQDIKSSNVLKYKKVATVQGPTFFYHWVIDRLPSILLLRDLILRDPEIKLLINTTGGQASGYVQEYLDLLGIPREQRIVVPARTLCYADTIYFATPFLMEPIPRKLLLRLRDELVEAANKKVSSQIYKDNLIVVIQRKEANRRISNLQDLLVMVKTRFPDCQIVEFNGDMSVSKQIQIFNHARLIIGLMASGLTNILYAKAGTQVIELHPISSCSQGAEWCWWLSSAVGLHYWVLPTQFGVYDCEVKCPFDGLRNILNKIVLENK